MTTAAWIVLALIAIVAVAGLRVVLGAGRGSAGTWRVFARVAGTIASAVLLYFFLLPPAGESQVPALKLLTADARPEDATAATGEIVLALPEAPAFANVVRVPDLGTALRRHPSATVLRIRGAGLESRDLDAAAGRRLEFTPPPLPAGIVELSAPTGVPSGRRFDVRGRVAGAPGGRIELLDPAGRRSGSADLDEDGRFQLQASAGPVGRVDFRLQVRGTDDRTLESLSLPLDVQAGTPLRVWVLAGAPGPELKYLRRWALDAGLALRTRIAVGGGVDIGDPPLPFTAATLREFDLVVMDDRAWRDLGDAGRAALRDAVRDGLGLLLRLTAEPGERERAVLREWGFAVDTAELARGLRLPGSELPDAAPAVATVPEASDADRATDTAPLLSRRPLRLQATDGVPLQSDDRGETLVLWRGEGRGRVALWALSDSFRLVLAGRRAAHGSLWAEAFATLARPVGERPLALPVAARVGTRSVVCGLDEGARVSAPDGASVSLRRDPASGERHCAAWWPTAAGWHELQSGGRTGRFPVRGNDEGLALAAVARQEATLALLAAPAASAGEAMPVPGPRWPWGLAWLLLSAGLWWLERRPVAR